MYHYNWNYPASGLPPTEVYSGYNNSFWPRFPTGSPTGSPYSSATQSPASSSRTWMVATSPYIDDHGSFSRSHSVRQPSSSHVNRSSSQRSLPLGRHRSSMSDRAHNGSPRSDYGSYPYTSSYIDDVRSSFSCRAFLPRLTHTHSITRRSTR